MGGGTMNRSNLFPLSLQGSSVSQSGRLPMRGTMRSVEVDRYLDLQGGEAIPSRVVILTALAEEFLEVEKHVPNLQQRQHPDGTIYECGRFERGGAVWDVAIVETGQGNSSAADETRRAIEFFKPDVVMFVGVAGGRKETQIGDVVAADKVYNYESGKDEDIFKPRPEAGRSSYPLEQRARSIARDWLRLQQRDASKPRAFVGPIAAGEVVVASTKSTTAQLIERNYGDALAVEKEGYGFLESARRSRGISAIVIRGISDLVDGKADSDAKGSQALAAKNASAFAFELLAQLNTPDGADRSQSAASTYEGESMSVDFNQKPPETVAMLYFYQSDQGYKLRIHHPQLKQVFDKSDLHLTLPTEFGRLQPWTVKTLSSLENYEPKICLLGQALQVLNYLRSKQPPLSCLVIHESDRPIVPWELLNLTAAEPLGVALQTVRMTETYHDDDKIYYEQMTRDNYYCQGQAMVYTTITEQTVQISCGIGIQAYSHEVIVQEKAIQILDHFKTVELDIGLVIMTDTMLQEITIEDRTRYFKRTKTFKQSPSLVMLRSGLESREHPVLAHQFLRHGAKGVLGMLDRIEGEMMQRVIELFFEQYGQAGDLTMPELLRRMRVTIAQRYDDEFTDEMAQLYLATFLYAYYGHPRTVLKLTPSSG
jgi:nucleoside phosphorylase